MASRGQPRYLWSMDPDPHRNPELSRLYRLAEAIASDISVREPDWCQIAADARTLAAHCDSRCKEQQLTRKEET